MGEASRPQMLWSMGQLFLCGGRGLSCKPCPDRQAWIFMLERGSLRNIRGDIRGGKEDVGAKSCGTQGANKISTETRIIGCLSKVKGRDRKVGRQNSCMLLLLFPGQQQLDTNSHFCHLSLLPSWF